jgi:YebC/PmpR family DNA-binding regulatory protein
MSAATAKEASASHRLRPHQDCDRIPAQFAKEQPMSGHSKWHSIKHKKAAADAKRGKIFTKLIRELSVAAKTGGGDPDKNPRLRKAILDAKGVNMPADNIKRAIQKGMGQLDGAAYEEITYEGYGPGGVAIFISTLTDNKNRTVSELRHILSKNGGRMGESGCVSWMFKRQGYVTIDKDKADEEKLLDIGLAAGAEDVKDDGSQFEITTTPETYEAVVEALKQNGIEIADSNVGWLPQNTVKVEGKPAEQILRLMEELEDHDDVQNVSANFDISEEEIAQFS